MNRTTTWSSWRLLAALLMAASCGLVGVSRTAWADEPQPAAAPYRLQAQAEQPPDLDAWRFTVAPYAWAIGVTGNATVRGQTIDTNASMIDLIQKSDSLGALMAYFEADKGKLGFYTDFVFAQLGFGAGQTNYHNPIAGLQITSRYNAALTYRLFIIEMGGIYELAKLPWSTEGSYSTLDANLGFRYWNNSVNATFDASANVNLTNLHFDRSFGIAIARSDAIQWVDPVIGLRMRHQFTPRQEVVVRGDVGGFGLSSGNQFSWQVVGTYGYSWKYTGYDVTALVGFRALSMNYSQGSGPDTFALNEILYGPIIGVRFRF